MSKPIPSTRGAYKPGVGVTITRGNIADERSRRLKDKLEPAEPSDIVEAFAFRKGVAHPRRYLARAIRLMTKG